MEKHEPFKRRPWSVTPETVVPRRPQPTPPPVPSEAPRRTPEDLLTDLDVAREYSIPRRTLQNMRVARRGPPFIKLGSGRQGRVYYQRSDLLAWFQQHRVQTQS